MVVLCQVDQMCQYGLFCCWVELFVYVFVYQWDYCCDCIDVFVDQFQDLLFVLFVVVVKVMYELLWIGDWFVVCGIIECVVLLCQFIEVVYVIGYVVVGW